MEDISNIVNNKKNKLKIKIKLPVLYLGKTLNPAPIGTAGHSPGLLADDRMWKVK